MLWKQQGTSGKNLVYGTGQLRTIAHDISLIYKYMMGERGVIWAPKPLHRRSQLFFCINTYMTPELLAEDEERVMYDVKVDIWAVRVVTR